MERKSRLPQIIRKGMLLLVAGGIIFIGSKLTYKRVVTLRTPPPVAEAAGLPVKTAAVTAGSIRETLNYIGTVRSDHEVFLAAKITAHILRLNAREGDLVRAGTTLVVLDDKELLARINTLRQKVTNARINVSYWQKEVARGKNLYEQGVIPVKQYEDTRHALDQAEGNLKEALAMLQEAETDLLNVTLKAPVDGIVTDVASYPGDLAIPGKTILTMADINRLKVEVKLVEGDLRKVQAGTKVLLHLRTGGEKVLTSRVSKIHPDVDPLFRTTIVEIPLPGDAGQVLKPGNSMEVTFILREKEEAVLVPRQAVLEDGEKSYVFVIADEKAYRQEIKKGIVSSAYVEVSEGLNKGEAVAVSNLTELYDGRPVYLYDWGREQ